MTVNVPRGMSTIPNMPRIYSRIRGYEEEETKRTKKLNEVMEKLFIYTGIEEEIGPQGKVM